jgi:hypothetical protein
MKFCAILLVICLIAPAVGGTGLIRTAFSLACNALIPVITLVLDTLINTITGLLSGIIGAVSGLLGSLPIVGGVVNEVLNLNDVLSAVTAVLNVRIALVGAVCGANGLLIQVESALCGDVCASGVCKNGAGCSNQLNAAGPSYSCTCLPDYSGENCEIENCPSGFVSQTGTKNCFKVVLEAHNWADSRARCPEIHPKAHLTTVLNSGTDQFIIGQLKALDAQAAAPCGGSFYTSGQRKVIDDCHSTFVWRPDTSTEIPLTYYNFAPGQPDCRFPVGLGGRPESCIHYISAMSYQWNDIPCDVTGCAICAVTLNN